MIRAMAAENDGSVWLALELQAGGARMSGALYDESGAEYHFDSWLGLLTLLEAAHVRAGPAEAAGGVTR
jgi:hypothetical protein